MTLMEHNQQVKKLNKKKFDNIIDNIILDLQGGYTRKQILNKYNLSEHQFYTGVKYYSNSAYIKNLTSSNSRKFQYRPLKEAKIKKVEQCKQQIQYLIEIKKFSQYQNKLTFINLFKEKYKRSWVLKAINLCKYKQIINQKSKNYIKGCALNASKLGANAVKIKSVNKFNIELKNNQNFILNLIKQGRLKTDIINICATAGIRKKTSKYVILKYKKILKHFSDSPFYHNPMEGISPSQSSGIGCKGWIMIDKQKIFFRSTLELFVYSYLLFKNKQFKLTKHRIPYLKNDKKRTYCPDIEIDEIIYQIKPTKLLCLDENKLKFQAAKLYFDKMYIQFGIITQKTFNLYEAENLINNMIQNGQINFLSNNDYDKFIKYRSQYGRKNNSY